MVKNNKGITLVALMVTVIVLLIITTAGISTTLDRFELNDYKKMKSDLELLEDKVSDYYLKYEGLPILRQDVLSYASSGQADQDMEEVTSKPVEFEYIEYLNKLTNTNQEPAINANDNDIYYIIDLEALGNITLNYGKDYKENLGKDDFYIINEQSHTIYYVKGVEIDGITYHYIKQDEQIFDDVPPTAPEINVVLGTENQGIYSNKIILEIVPGKEKITQVRETSYIVTKNDNEIIRENINDTKQIELNDFGRYKIVAYTTDTGENSSNETVYEFEIKKIYYRKKNGEDAQGYLLSDYENTEVWDLYDNKLIVPAGFKITYDSKNVTEGTVIEDDTGNQFVWIPVSKTSNDEDKIKNSSKSATIPLGRYEFESGGKYKNYNGECTEDTISKHNSKYENEIAIDIDNFLKKVNDSGGYYLGRYEARTNISDLRKDKSETLTDVTLQAEHFVYTNVTQKDASELCKKMYNSSNFTSDLINSYSWDTAIIFIQHFSGTNDYGTIGSDSKKYEKGTSEDRKCNIYDMAGNYYEWTTETSANTEHPCIYRGDTYDSGFGGNEVFDYTESRTSWWQNSGRGSVSFRPILYL